MDGRHTPTIRYIASRSKWVHQMWSCYGEALNSPFDWGVRPRGPVHAFGAMTACTAPQGITETERALSIRVNAGTLCALLHICKSPWASMEFQPYKFSGQPAVQSVVLLHHINHISDGVRKFNNCPMNWNHQVPQVEWSIKGTKPYI